MSLDFLSHNGASRVTGEVAQPGFLFDDPDPDTAPQESVNLEIETSANDWAPQEVLSSGDWRNWDARPARFVDGKDVGRTVAWLQNADGYPCPVRLAQVGAIAMREANGELRREFAHVERVVVMADMFPWEEVESFGRALKANGFRLLLVNPPQAGWSHPYEPVRKAASTRSITEMIELEKLAFSQDRSVPTILDGPLSPRTSIPTDNVSPVIGVVKTHARNYLHPHGWKVFYNLQPGQRTPAFRVESQRWGGFSVVSWYLRLDGAGGEMPNWGVVRLEAPEGFFTQTLGGSFDYLNRVSRLVYDYRCRDEGYSRAPVSLHPIQRAEESLGALFTESDTLISRFYRLTSL